MVMELIILVTEVNIKDNGVMITKMEQVFSYMLMGIDMKENLGKEKKAEMVSIIIQMEIDMKENGKMIKDMG